MDVQEDVTGRSQTDMSLSESSMHADASESTFDEDVPNLVTENLDREEDVHQEFTSQEVDVNESLDSSGELPELETTGSPSHLSSSPTSTTYEDEVHRSDLNETVIGAEDMSSPEHSGSLEVESDVASSPEQDLQRISSRRKVPRQMFTFHKMGGDPNLVSTSR